MGFSCLNYSKQNESPSAGIAGNLLPKYFNTWLKDYVTRGADVYDLGLATTPGLLRYGKTSFWRFGTDGFHNGAEYNGLKVSGRDAMPIGYDNGLNFLEDCVLHKEPLVSEKR